MFVRKIFLPRIWGGASAPVPRLLRLCTRGQLLLPSPVFSSVTPVQHRAMRWMRVKCVDKTEYSVAIGSIRSTVIELFKAQEWNILLPLLQPFYGSSGHPGWAGTRRNIHPLTPNTYRGPIIYHLLSPSITISVREYVFYVFFSDFKKTWLFTFF